jgi:hypothetical protein
VFPQPRRRRMQIPFRRLPCLLAEAVKHKKPIRERDDVLGTAAAVLRRIEGELRYRALS